VYQDNKEDSMKRQIWIVGLTVVVLVLLAGGIAWAQELEQGRPVQSFGGHLVRGIVVDETGDEITVEMAGGERATLLINDKTRMWVPGEPPTTEVELAAGDAVLALGRPEAAAEGVRTLAAILIVVAGDEDVPRITVRGRVVAVIEQTIVVQTGRGERAVTVLPRTLLWSAQGRLDSLRDVRPGEPIVALGQPTEFGQWIAGVVLVPGPAPLARNGIRGEVVTIDLEAGTLAVETEQRGTISVVAAEGTRYRIPGVEEPGLANIQVGDQILALGRFEEGSSATFQARIVGVVHAPSGEPRP
jgi:RNase P/RNase MRP subunit p29